MSITPTGLTRSQVIAESGQASERRVLVRLRAQRGPGYAATLAIGVVDMSVGILLSYQT